MEKEKCGIRNWLNIMLLCLILLFTFNTRAYGLNNDIVKEQDKAEYKLIEDNFDRSFFGGMIQRLKLRINSSRSEGITEIVKDTVWTEEKGPYYIDEEVRVYYGSTLTIEEGTTIYFSNGLKEQDGSGFLVDGNLVIKGALNNEVKLLPSNREEEKASWSGIYVTERGNLNATYMEIDGVDSWSDSAIYALGNLSLNNCIIKNTQGTGITALNNAVITGCSIKNNTNYGVDLYRHLRDYQTVVKNNNIVSNGIAGRIVYSQTTSSNYEVKDNIVNNNVINGFKLKGDILGDITFGPVGENTPFIIVNHGDIGSNMTQFTVNNNSNVTFDKCIVKFEGKTENHSPSKIIVNGTLNILGDSSNKTIFTSLKNHSALGDTASLGNVEPQANDWDGIYVNKDGTVNVNYGEVSYGSSLISSYGQVGATNSTFSNSYNGISVWNNVMRVENSKFDNFSKYGFHYSATSQPSDITLKNNSFSGIKDRIGKIYLYKSGGDKLIATGNTSRDNKKNGVELMGEISLNTRINNIGKDIPYIIPTLTISGDSTVNIDPGTIFKIEDGSFGGEKTNIDIKGKLICNGTEAQNVIFTSLKDDSIGGDSNGDESNSSPSNGDWGAINIYGKRGNENASMFNYTNVSYGGDNGRKYMLGGNGAFIVNNSIIKNSSEDGIGVKGELILNNSVIESNDKIGVHMSSDESFMAQLNDNKFLDNKDFAAFITFGTTKDKFTGKNNVGINNNINGIGVSGILHKNFQFSSAGDEFPFVVKENLTVKPGATLSINEGVTTKFLDNSQFTLDGKLDIRGSEGQKVYFTSVKDDTIAGDTNNDGNATKSSYGDWDGIIYSNESEGFFKNFICVDAKYNMDYEKIPYVKAISKGDNQVSIFENNAVYIKSVDGKDNLVLYNFVTGEEKIISFTSNAKYSPMISGNYVAWIENGNINLYNLLSGSKSIIDKFDSGYYLNDGYMAWISGGKLKYKAASAGVGSETIIEGIDNSFTPVISSKYVLYKKLNEANIYKRDMVSNEEFYMMSSMTDCYKADIYNDNIAILGKDSKGQAYNVMVGEIPSWTAVQVTGNTSTSNDYVALNKDKVSYYRRGTGDGRNIIIEKTENGDGSKLKIVSKLTTGYEVYANDLSNENCIFTDGNLVYLIKTNTSNTTNYFVKGNSKNSTNYDREMAIEGGLNVSLGIDAEAGIVSGGLTARLSKRGTLNYGIQNNSLNEPINLSIGRDIVREMGSESDLSLGIDIGQGMIGDFGASASIGATASNMKKLSDEYTFDAMRLNDSFEHIALLTGATLLRSSDSLLNNVLANIIEEKLQDLVLNSDNYLGYTRENGIGIKYGASSNIGTSADLIKFSTSGSVEANGLAEVGKEAVSNGVVENYVKLTNGYNAKYSSSIDVNIPDYSTDLEGGKKLNLMVKIPSAIWNSSESSKIIFEMKLLENNKLEVKISDGTEDENGFIKVYTYKISGADYGYMKSNGLLKGVEDLERNLGVLDKTNLLLPSYSLLNDISIFKNLNDLVTILENCNAVDYEISLVQAVSKPFDRGIDVNVEDPSINPGLKPKMGIGISCDTKDIVNLTIDKGTISKGYVVADNNIMAFIPVENESMTTVLKNIVCALVKQINPDEIKFVNGVAVYNGEKQQAKITIGSGVEASKAIFMESLTDVVNKNDEENPIGDDNYLFKDSIYFQSLNDKGEEVNDYGGGSELKLYIGSKWKEEYKHKYSIYQYDEKAQQWMKLGGKINIDERSIAVPLKKNGQYALGVDKGCPDIIWTDNYDRILSEGSHYGFESGEYINIQIVDDQYSIKSKIIINNISNDTVEELNRSGKNFSHYINGNAGDEYRLTVEYYDEFGNCYNESMRYYIKRSNTLSDQEMKKYDINCDGNIDIIDLALIANSDEISIENELWDEVFDINKDEIINILDINELAGIL